MKRPLALLLALLAAAPSHAVVRTAVPAAPRVNTPAVRLGGAPSLLTPSLTPSAPGIPLSLSAPALAPAPSASIAPAAAPLAAPSASVLVAPAAGLPAAAQAPRPAEEAVPSAREQLAAAAEPADVSDRLWTGAADAKKAKAQLAAAHRETFKFFMGSRVGLLRSMIKEQEQKSAGTDRSVKDLEGMWIAWRTKGYSGRVQTAGFEVADRVTVRREAYKTWEKYFTKDAAARAAFDRYMERVDRYVPLSRPSNYRKLAFGAIFLTPIVPVAGLAAAVDAMLSEAHLAAIAAHRAERQDAIVASFRDASLAAIREVNKSLPEGKKIVAVAMLGSYSIGQSTPDSDIDFQLVTQDGSPDGIEPFKAALGRLWVENRIDKLEAFQFALPPSPEVVKASFNEGYRVFSPDPRAVAALSTDRFEPPVPTAWSRLRGRLFEKGYAAWIRLNFLWADLRGR
jgi:hypothetical protein